MIYWINGSYGVGKTTINNQKLYDSTFLSYAYQEKKNMPFKDIESFTKEEENTLR